MMRTNRLRQVASPRGNKSHAGAVGVARGPTCQPMMKMMATRLRVDVGISGFGFITYSALKNNKLSSCQWRASASPKGSFFFCTACTGPCSCCLKSATKDFPRQLNWGTSRLSQIMPSHGHARACTAETSLSCRGCRMQAFRLGKLIAQLAVVVSAG